MRQARTRSLLRRDGRACFLANVPAGANNIIASLTSKGGLSTGRFVIKRKVLELGRLRRRNGNVAVNPAVGYRFSLLEHRTELSIDPPIPPRLPDSLPAVARIKDQRALDLHPDTTVTTKLQTKRAAFERVHAFE